MWPFQMYSAAGRCSLSHRQKHRTCSVRTFSSLSQTCCPPNSPDLNTVNLPSEVLCSRRSTIIIVSPSVNKMKRAIVKSMTETTAWHSHCQFVTFITFLFTFNVIRQMAPLFSKIDLNKWHDVQNRMKRS